VIGGILIISASAFTFNFVTSSAAGFNLVTLRGGPPHLPRTDTMGNVSNNSTGQAHLIGKVNVSSVAKSVPFSVPRYENGPSHLSPFSFHPSNVTENKTHVFAVHLPFHFLNSSSFKQPINRSQIGPKNITDPPVGRPGIDGSDNTNWCGGQACTPPDVQIAVGHGIPEIQQKYAVEMTNDALMIFGYPFACSQVCPPGSDTVSQPLRTFFKLPATNLDFITDPKVFYDELSHRFFASISDFTTNSVMVAVSTSANPNANWNVYNFPFNNCPDQPKIGASSGVFAISANLYTNNCNPNNSAFICPPARENCTGVQFHLVNKDDLVKGVTTPRFTSFPCIASPGNPCLTDQVLSHNAFSLTPVGNSRLGDPILKLVDTEPFNGKTYTLIYSISDYLGRCAPNEGCFPSRCAIVLIVPFNNVCPVEIHPPNYIPANPALAAQPGTAVRLDTGDSRITSASVGGDPDSPAGASLWFAYNERCDHPHEGNSCIHLVQMRYVIGTTGVGTHLHTDVFYQLRADFQVTAAPNDAFYPALDVDRDQNLALIFGFSGPGQFPSIAVSRQDYNPLNPQNTIQPPATAVSGTSSDASNSAGMGPTPRCMVCSRYGDFFGAAANPDEGNSWLAGEYMSIDPTTNRPIYSTWIVQAFIRP
jgi:hypothetical protein